jgi:hypothetical protein
MNSELTDRPLSAGWAPAAPLSESQLSGTFWSFGLLGQKPYTPFLVLAPGGLIGNYYHQNEDLWQVVDGKLVFMSSSGVPTTTYNAAQFDGGKVVALAGRTLIEEGPDFHELRQVDHPQHPLSPTPKDADRRAEFIAALERPRCRNLVVLRAGEGSLHPHWRGDLPETARNWDLCISYYGQNPADAAGEFEYLTHQPAQRKFQAIFDLFFPDSPLWAYDQIWIPDDDIMTSWNDINSFFHVTRKYGLDLAQPSLQQRPDCFITHGITAQQPRSLLRYVSFIEIMCPLFSKRALQICRGTFRDSWSGFGLDHLWPSLLGKPRARMAIVDSIGVIHTRPLGKNYNVSQAMAEERALLDAYQIARVWLNPITVS